MVFVLCFSGVKLWNALALDVRQITPFSRFCQNTSVTVYDWFEGDGIFSVDSYFCRFDPC